MLHVTNGDSTVRSLEASGLPGTFLPWRDVLHEGPVPAGLDLDDLSHVRADFLASQGWGDRATLRAEFARRDASLRAAAGHDEVVLWFEHDLYDQLQLIQVLDTLAHLPTRPGCLTWVVIDRYPGISRFVGLGQLSPEQLAGLFPERRAVSDDAIAHARSAWAAFRAPDPTALGAWLKAEGDSLPWLATALGRHLRQFPSVATGLSLAEQWVVEQLAHGPQSPAQLFHDVSEREPAPFLGDSTFLHYLQRLNPLVVDAQDALDRADPTLPDGLSREDRLALSPVGRAVLDGSADALDVLEIDRWMGGVHLTDPATCWRWSESSGRLHPGRAGFETRDRAGPGDDGDG